ncbi:MAG TPA: PEGA domain-containing protein [Gemmatimonadaceae bacterium]|nr:PEGA domain-containing protein [Gemmatimonadaceae bacterium]
MPDESMTPPHDHHEGNLDLCWLVQGVSEPCGERFALFDDDGQCREALRVRRDLAALPGFEPALRYGVRQFSRAHPASAASVQLVSDRTGESMLVVDVPEGLRLSDIIETRAPLDPHVVRSLAYELLGAVQALHQGTKSSPHGALIAERFVLTARGHFVVLDGGLGTALHAVPNTREAYWNDLRVAMPVLPVTAEALDLYQIATIVLELAIGRRLSRGEFPDRMPDLVQAVASTPLVDIARWLRIALGIEATGGFAKADVALDALVSATAPHLDTRHGQTMAACMRSLGLTADPFGPEWSTPDGVVRPDIIVAEAAPVSTQLTEAFRQIAPGAPASAGLTVSPQGDPITADDVTAHTSVRGALNARSGWRTERTAIAIAVLLLLAVASTGVVWAVRARSATPVARGTQLSRMSISSSPTGADVFVDQKPRGRTPLTVEMTPGPHVVRLTRDGSTREIAVTARAGVDGTQYLEFPAVTPVVTAAAQPSTAVPTTIATRQTVPRRRVQPTTSTPAPDTPNETSTNLAPQTGVASFNATPWADVAVDGRPIGQTPLGNVTLAVGVHDVTFSNPAFETQHRTITISADTPARIGVDLRRRP